MRISLLFKIGNFSKDKKINGFKLLLDNYNRCFESGGEIPLSGRNSNAIFVDYVKLGSIRSGCTLIQCFKIYFVEPGFEIKRKALHLIVEPYSIFDNSV